MMIHRHERCPASPLERIPGRGSGAATISPTAPSCPSGQRLFGEGRGNSRGAPPVVERAKKQAGRTTPQNRICDVYGVFG